VPVRARTTVLAVAVALAGLLALAAGELQAATTSSYASCPRSDRTVPTSKLPGARGELVPAGSTGVLLCRYRGLNPYSKRFSLLASKKVSKSATVAELSTQLDALPRQAGVFACPDDSGTLIVAYFHYRSGPDDVVSVQTSGCGLVSNGHVHRTAALTTGQNLVRELESMTR
jgi:hypothetical protein